MLIIFDRGRKYLEVFKRNDEWLSLLGKFPAANNAASNSRGPWPFGVYKAEKLVRLQGEDADPNGPYGAYFLRFIVPDRDGIDDAIDLYQDGLPDKTDGPGIGMGVHSGRRDGVDLQGRQGYLRATMGCIRTTDDAMKAIADAWDADGECQLVVLD